VAIGFAVGFRLHGNIGAGLAAFALCVLFGFAFIWLFVTIGLFAGNAQAAQGMSLLVFPLTFVSSAYVPVHSMPGWLQAFAEHSRSPSWSMLYAPCASATAYSLCSVTVPGTTSCRPFFGQRCLVAVFGSIAVTRFGRG
jgi:ABC-type multidrug transport system permease subunit